MRCPAAWLAVPVCLGTSAGLIFFEIDRLPLAAAFAAALALAAATATHAAGEGEDFIVCLAAGALCAGLSLGASAARWAYEPPLLRTFRGWTHAHPVGLEGTLTDDAARGATGVTLAMHVRRVRDPGGAAHQTAGGVRLSVAGELAPERMHDWRAGRELRVFATLREPTVYLNPGVPDDTRALARRGIVLVGSVKSAGLVEVVAPGSPIEELAGRVRNSVRRTLDALVGAFDRRSAAIATAILIGDRTGLAEEDERRLQEAGTYHVVAISGGNIAIFTAGLIGLFRLLGVTGRASSAAAIVLVLAYGQIVVGAPSVERAITAAVLFLAGRLIDQTGPPLNVLAVAAAFALGLAPASAFDPGFILSFGATLGILVVVPRLSARLLPPRTWRRVPAGLLAATIAADIALFAAGAVIFGRVTAAGLVVNFAAIPLMSLVQAGSLGVLALAPLHEPAARATGWVVHLAAAGLVESARFVEVVPWTTRQVPAPSWPLAAAYYTAVLVALRVPALARAGWTAAALLATVMAAGDPRAAQDGVPPPPPRWLRVMFLDVGQGDATLLRMPDGRAYLVDAGGFPIPALSGADGGTMGRFDIGARVVGPSLRAVGVRRLDTFVLTHGDPDHIGGAPAVAREFRPRAFWEGAPVPPHPELAALVAIADGLRAQWRTVQAGDMLRLGDVRLEVLHPPPPDWERQRVRNEDSIVLRVTLGDVTFVLPGDIGREGEAAVLSRLGRAGVTILKAAHHGSATSSTAPFIRALAPDAVIFSAGRRNPFGHPAPAVVARFRAAGAALFSTAEDGAVIVDTDGRKVEFRTWSGRRMTCVPAPRGRAEPACADLSRHGYHARRPRRPRRSRRPRRAEESAARECDGALPSCLGVVESME